jgi:hypothetical protein
MRRCVVLAALFLSLGGCSSIVPKRSAKDIEPAKEAEPVKPADPGVPSGEASPFGS